MDDQLEETEFDDWKDHKDGIAVLSGAEWEKATDIRANYLLGWQEDNIHFCKLESYSDYLFGTFHIPEKGHYRNNYGFAFYILQRKMIFIDDTGIVGTQIAQIRQARMRKGYTLERFLYDFLISLIDDDLLYLSALEKKIAGMEERILEREDKELTMRCYA